MYAIEIQVQCPTEHSEVSDDLNATELLVENVVSQALLELFETVYVRDVTIRIVRREYSDLSVF